MATSPENHDGDVKSGRKTELAGTYWLVFDDVFEAANEGADVAICTL